MPSPIGARICSRIWGSLLVTTRGLSHAMVMRGRIVAAACEAAEGATQVSLFMATGLSDHEGGFGPDRPLSSQSMRWSDEEAERGIGLTVTACPSAVA